MCCLLRKIRLNCCGRKHRATCGIKRTLQKRWSTRELCDLMRFCFTACTDFHYGKKGYLKYTAIFNYDKTQNTNWSLRKTTEKVFYYIYWLFKIYGKSSASTSHFGIHASDTWLGCNDKKDRCCGVPSIVFIRALIKKILLITKSRTVQPLTSIIILMAWQLSKHIKLPILKLHLHSSWWILFSFCVCVCVCVVEILNTLFVSQQEKVSVMERPESFLASPLQAGTRQILQLCTFF